MKRVLVVDQFSDLGGSQRALLDLLPALRRDFQVHFALPGSGALTDELERQGTTWTPVPLGEYELGRKSLSDLAAFAVRQPRMATTMVGLARRADLIYANGPRIFPATAL